VPEITNVIAAFTEDHVQRLTGLSKGRLRYWNRTGFFAPAYHKNEKRTLFSRIYSFNDIVALRTLEMLRVQNNVPLQHLRKVAEKLSHLNAHLWTKTTLWAFNRKVVFQEPGTDRPQEVVSAQYVMGIELRRVISDTERDVEALRRRTPDEIGHIAKARGVSRNAAVLAGTRIHVASIRRFHEDGFTTAEIIAEYPDLTEDDVLVAIGDTKAEA